MKKRILFLAILAIISFIISVTLFWTVEHQYNHKIRNLLDVIWWWFVTSATVGYGDVVPVTLAGRVVAVFTIVTGFIIYTYMVGIIVDSAHEFMEGRDCGKNPLKLKDHIVICEYTSMADELLQSLPTIPEFSHLNVAIVTDLVTHRPYSEYEFVFGVPINPLNLKKASVESARYVFVFANMRFTDPDVKTLHIALRVLDLNPKASIFVEIVNVQDELIRYIPDNIIVMPSRELMKTILMERKIGAAYWLKITNQTPLA
ncbi:potassium channel family protein [Methylomagnum sp.]